MATDRPTYGILSTPCIALPEKRKHDAVPWELPEACDEKAPTLSAEDEDYEDPDNEVWARPTILPSIVQQPVREAPLRSERDPMDDRN